MGISLLMFCISGDKRAVKVRSYLEDKCGDNEMLQRIVWQCDRDDSEVWVAAPTLHGRTGGRWDA